MAVLLASNAAAADLCLTPPEQDKIALVIKALEKCKIEIDAKEELIQNRVVGAPAAPSVAWFQEPTVIIGGTVVSFAVGSLLTYALIRR